MRTHVMRADAWYENSKTSNDIPFRGIAKYRDLYVAYN